MDMPRLLKGTILYRCTSEKYPVNEEFTISNSYFSVGRKVRCPSSRDRPNHYTLILLEDVYDRDGQFNELSSGTLEFIPSRAIKVKVIDIFHPSTSAHRGWRSVLSELIIS